MRAASLDTRAEGSGRQVAVEAMDHRAIDFSLVVSTGRLANVNRVWQCDCCLVVVLSLILVCLETEVAELKKGPRFLAVRSVVERP